MNKLLGISHLSSLEIRYKQNIGPNVCLFELYENIFLCNSL